MRSMLLSQTIWYSPTKSQDESLEELSLNNDLPRKIDAAFKEEPLLHQVTSACLTREPAAERFVQLVKRKTVQIFLLNPNAMG